MFASFLKTKLNAIRPEWNKNIFEIKKEKLLSNIEHEEIEIDCNEYSENQIVNFAEPIEGFCKTKSLSNFASCQIKVYNNILKYFSF